MAISCSNPDRIDNPLAAARFIADWAGRIAVPCGPLPGSTLTDPQPTHHGYAFTGRLTRSRQVVDDAVRQAPAIAARMGRRTPELVITPHPRIKASSVCQ